MLAHTPALGPLTSIKYQGLPWDPRSGWAAPCSRLPKWLGNVCCVVEMSTRQFKFWCTPLMSDLLKHSPCYHESVVRAAMGLPEAVEMLVIVAQLCCQFQ